MNNLAVLCNLFLLSIVYLRCSSSILRGSKDLRYTYVLTEYAEPGSFGRVEGPNGPCQNTFFQNDYQPYVTVGYHTGILRLENRLTFLHKDRDGIRRLTINIITRTCYPHVAIRVELIIFPLKFGDPFLRQSGRLLRVVQRSTIFGTSTSNSLLRFLRLVAPQIERIAFDRIMSAIRAKRIIELALNNIISMHVTKTESKRMFRIWHLNSLFSRYALRNLAKVVGCKEKEDRECPIDATFRTIDGTCNNIQNPLFGYAPNTLKRLVPARYFDAQGLNDPIGFPDQPLAPNVPSTFKVVRDFIEVQEHPQPKDIYSHAVMQWGQWLDHDLDLSPESESSDNCQEVPCDGSREDFAAPCFTILPIPKFKCINFARSAAECQVKNGRITVRQQINVNTAFIDGSQVYGSTDILAKELRDLTNEQGLLRTVPGVNGDFLPPDNSELVAPNSFCLNLGGCFLAGDSRSSEQQVLATMHTLFVREHNRLARALRKINPQWNGERTYQEARRIVGAVLQKITYDDYLPIIIGNTLPKYLGYNPTVNPDIVNAFSTAAYRFGHSTIRPTFDRLDANFDPTGDPLPLRFLFFNNTFIRQFGIDPLLLGLLGNASQTVDRKLASALLNNLFERPNSPGLNLAALNIQRGRDHGLPGYNAFRRFCGFQNAKSFKDTHKEIPSRRNREILAKLYNDNPEVTDLWPAGLAEAPANGGIVGATFGCIIREQLRRIRDGDSFFYQRSGVFTQAQVYEIQKTTLSRILCDNLQTIVSVQRNAFLAGTHKYRRVECSQIPGIDLLAWKLREISYV